MDYQKLKIAQFELDKMVDHPAIVIIAKRGTGKSVMAKDILYHLRKKPGGVVISPTDKMNGEYKKFFPDIYIHYDITEEILNRILLRQVEMMEKQKNKKKEGIKLDPSGILVMDDCLSKKKTWAKIQAVTEILMNGRHYKLTYILTMQAPLGLLPDLRSNFDYIFLLKENSALNRKKLWANYASMFPSLILFEKTFAKITENFCSLVIDNRKATDNIVEQVYWYKASPRKFSFGCNEFKELHRKYFDKNHALKNNEALRNAVACFGRKRNDPEIKIQKI